MSEKVLGFYEEQCKRTRKKFRNGNEVLIDYLVMPDELVPVVSLEKLEEICHQRGYYSQKAFVIKIETLLLAAEKEAKKNQGGEKKE